MKCFLKAITASPNHLGANVQIAGCLERLNQPQAATEFARRGEILAELESVVMKCLAKRPADRWQSADELLAQLEPLATPSGGMTPTATRPMKAVTAGGSRASHDRQP